MELVKLDAGTAELVVNSEDCAALARICREAEDNLMSLNDAPLLALARAFGALFRAATVACLTPGCQSQKQLATDLESLGLSDLITH